MIPEVQCCCTESAFAPIRQRRYPDGFREQMSGMVRRIAADFSQLMKGNGSSQVRFNVLLHGSDGDDVAFHGGLTLSLADLVSLCLTILAKWYDD